MNRYKIIIVLILSLVYNINTNTYGHETFDIEIEEDVYYVPNNGNMIYITAYIVKEGEYEYADPEEWYWDDDGLDSYQDGGDEEDSTL